MSHNKSTEDTTPSLKSAEGLSHDETIDELDETIDELDETLNEADQTRSSGKRNHSTLLLRSTKLEDAILADRRMYIDPPNVVEITDGHTTENVVKLLIKLIGNIRVELSHKKPIKKFKIGKSNIEKSSAYYSFDKKNPWTYSLKSRWGSSSYKNSNCMIILTTPIALEDVPKSYICNYDKAHCRAEDYTLHLESRLITHYNNELHSQEVDCGILKDIAENLIFEGQRATFDDIRRLYEKTGTVENANRVGRCVQSQKYGFALYMVIWFQGAVQTSLEELIDTSDAVTPFKAKTSTQKKSSTSKKSKKKESDGKQRTMQEFMTFKDSSLHAKDSGKCSSLAGDLGFSSENTDSDMEDLTRKTKLMTTNDLSD